ncbi:hypothetical protein HYU40_02070 [Candidatus Woesearchaeota archaeon]|nr:hypothetical protein [Candidatus Woesearchaeota archaeon]
MKKKFILVNRSILDFDVFREDFHKLVGDLKPELFEMVSKYGFELVKVGKQSEFRRKVVFYNRQFDMQLTIVAKKQRPPEFV